MGNQSSVPERVYRAVKGNNIYELQVRVPVSVDLLSLT